MNPKLIINTPDRPDDLSVVAWRGRKKTWKLLDAAVAPNGEVWQAYANRRSAGGLAEGEYDDRQSGDLVHDDVEEKSDVDSIILLIWEP